MTDDPVCKRCGHVRSMHEEDRPYECFDLFFEDDDEDGTRCTCDGFSYVENAK